MTIQEAMYEQELRERALKLRRYEQLNRYAVRNQTVFAGSSLIEQFPASELLAARGGNAIVYNRGIGGYTTEDMMDVLDILVFDLEPFLLVLSIGTNDLNNPLYSLGQLAKNVSYIIDRTKERLPGTVICWLSFYPVNPEAAPEGMAEVFQHRTNARIDEANIALKDLLGTKGVKFLDANAGLRDAQGRLRRELTIDGIHLYPEGYKIVFDEIYPAVFG